MHIQNRLGGWQRLFRSAIAAGIAGAVMAGCSPPVSRLDPGPDGAQVNQLARLLPSPSALKQTAAEAITELPGDGYSPALPHNRVFPKYGGIAQYEPDYHKHGDTFSNLAYAVYSFNLAGYTGPETLHLFWDATAGFENAWSGLANFARGRWDWRSVPAVAGGESLLAVPLADYRQPDTQQLYVVLAFTSSEHWRLSRLRFGDPLAPGNWTRTWGSSDMEWIADGASDMLANLYLAGAAGQLGYSARVALLLKYDNAGNLLWARTWGGDGVHQIHALATDTRNNLYAVGLSQPLDQHSSMLVLKITPAGDLAWAKLWDTNASWAVARGVAVDMRDNLLVAGDVVATNIAGGTPVQSFDLALVALDPEGRLMWDRRWDSADHEQPCGITTDPAGRCYVGLVQSDIAGAPDPRPLVLAAGPSGNLDWARAYFSTQQITLHSIKWCGEGRLLLAGAANTTLSQQALLLQLASSGEVQQCLTWRGNVWEAANDVFLSAGGVMNLIGCTRSFDTGDNGDGLLVRIALDGTLLGAETFGTDGVAETLVAGGYWPGDWIWLCGQAAQPAAVPATAVNGTYGSLALASQVEPAALVPWNGETSISAIGLADGSGVSDAATGDEENCLALVRQY